MGMRTNPIVECIDPLMEGWQVVTLILRLGSQLTLPPNKH